MIHIPAEDRLAIHEVTARYIFLCDTKDYAAVSGVFTEAGVWDETVVGFPLCEGRAAINEMFTSMAQADLEYVVHIQGSQTVTGPVRRRARIDAIHGFENFCSRGMPVAFHQECHHGKALRSTPQPAALEGALDPLTVHESLRLCLIWYFVKTWLLLLQREETQQSTGNLPLRYSFSREKKSHAGTCLR